MDEWREMEKEVEMANEWETECERDVGGPRGQNNVAATPPPMYIYIPYYIVYISTEKPCVQQPQDRYPGF